jgi:8-oxo-dGTP pyrophosphatase MutT (NUDIX family)
MATMEDLVGTLGRTLATRQRRVVSSPDRSPAAVLVPLLAVDGAPHLLYTRRANHLSRHSGQVAFPGGRVHPDEDADLAGTALRESHEEIGLAPTDVRLLGTLDDIETVSSSFVITPFVGVVPHPYPWQASPDEVDAIFTVPLDTLRSPTAEQHEVWDFGGRPIAIDTYRVAGQVIWGATQRITRNLLAVLAGSAP